MDVTLMYVDGCPSWREAEARLHEALALVGRPEVAVTLRRIETDEEAVAAEFRGSPTFLVDGADPFAEDGGGFGLSCRLYRTDAGLVGSPTVDQLVATLG
jgi:hypothetical protein